MQASFSTLGPLAQQYDPRTEKPPESLKRSKSPFWERATSARLFEPSKNLVAPALPQAIFGKKKAHLKVGLSTLLSTKAGERT